MSVAPVNYWSACYTCPFDQKVYITHEQLKFTDVPSLNYAVILLCLTAHRLRVQILLGLEVTWCVCSCQQALNIFQENHAKPVFHWWCLRDPNLHVHMGCGEESAWENFSSELPKLVIRVSHSYALWTLYPRPTAARPLFLSPCSTRQELLQQTGSAGGGLPHNEVPKGQCPLASSPVSYTETPCLSLLYFPFLSLKQIKAWPFSLSYLFSFPV